VTQPTGPPLADLQRDDFAALDRSDPLAPLRERFVLPPGAIYLDGNSLGALPRSTPGRLARVIEQEWGGDLITSWNRHRWIEMPQRIGAKIARLIGAGADEVVAAESSERRPGAAGVPGARGGDVMRVVLT
jgi:kynureninase